VVELEVPKHQMMEEEESPQEEGFFYKIEVFQLLPV